MVFHVPRGFYIFPVLRFGFCDGERGQAQRLSPLFIGRVCERKCGKKQSGKNFFISAVTYGNWFHRDLLVDRAVFFDERIVLCVDIVEIVDFEFFVHLVAVPLFDVIGVKEG